MGKPQSAEEIGLFIFLVPQGTVGQDLFVSPIYKSLRRIIAKKCFCEFSVFNGNNFTPSSHSPSQTLKCGFCNTNNLGCMCAENETGGAILTTEDPYEQILLSKGNWLVQVTYLTEPSLHRLFLKLVSDYCIMLGRGWIRTNKRCLSMTQGFKYTTLAAITHEKLRRKTKLNDNYEHQPVQSQQKEFEMQVSEGSTNKSQRSISTDNIDNFTDDIFTKLSRRRGSLQKCNNKNGTRIIYTNSQISYSDNLNAYLTSSESREDIYLNKLRQHFNEVTNLKTTEKKKMTIPFKAKLCYADKSEVNISSSFVECLSTNSSTTIKSSYNSPIVEKED